MIARALTFTIVFKSSAVNRDENLGNIQYIKKLRRADGVYAYISRPFLRHHLFNTLHRAYGWKPARVTAGENVVQFDISEESVVTSEELDFFGYMSTVSDTVTRKAPVGMTKAISLEKWEYDSTFHANHDMVRRAVMRGKNATPNPYSKEEFFGLFKYSISLDIERIGYDEVYYVLKNKEDGKKKGKKKGEKKPKIFGVEINSEGGTVEMENGEISWTLEKDRYKVIARVKPTVKKKRIEQFLEVILGGFELHSSGESYSTAPLFVAAAALKAPMNLLDPFVKIKEGKVNAEVLRAAFDNPLIEKEKNCWVLPIAIELDGNVESDKVEVLKNRSDLLEKIKNVIEGNGK